MNAPKGRILDGLQAGTLAHDYAQFLQREDPLERWKDVVAHAEDIACSVDPGRYAMPKDLVDRLSGKVPGIRDLLANVEFADHAARRLGLRYAYLRFQQHALMLEATERLAADIRFPLGTFIEAGCFTGGFLHFLARRHPKARAIGIDVSPVALDVASDMARRMRLGRRMHWLEVDFLLAGRQGIESAIGTGMGRPVVFLCNMISTLGHRFADVPAVAPWQIEAGLISYWVRQGAMVILCERHDHPDLLLETLVHAGDWQGANADVAVLARQHLPTTMQMTRDNLVGKWSNAMTCVLGFHGRQA